MNNKKVLKGFNYVATAAAPATITDSNGIVLCELSAGKQGYFVATTETIDVGSAEDVSVVEIRSNFVVPHLTDAGSSGGHDFEEGMIVGIGPQDKYTNVGAILTYGGSLFHGNTTLTEWYGNMPALTVANGQGATSSNLGMFQNCTNLTTFVSDMPSLQNGRNMFDGCSKLESFEVPSGELTSLTDGYRMFFNCSSLKSFCIDMPNLTSGQNMFQGCTSLETYEPPSGQLPQNLTTTEAMFNGCPLREFNYELPSGITTSWYMFWGTRLERFDIDIPQNCQDARYMFQNATRLTTYTGELHSNRLQCQNMFDGCTSLKTLWPQYAGQEFPWSLRNVNYMFLNCTSLESFPFTLGGGYGICTGMFQGCSKLQWTTPLPSALYSAVGFFGGCKLNKASVQTIINSPTRTSSSAITIGIDSTLITQEEQDAYNTQLVNKRWTVTWQRN